MDIPSIFDVRPDDLYNIIMAQIEPELVIGTVETLKEQYKNESEADQKKRFKRYERAFEQYKIEKQLYLERAQEEVAYFLKNKRFQAEQESLKDEKQILSNLEAMFT